MAKSGLLQRLFNRQQCTLMVHIYLPSNHLHTNPSIRPCPLIRAHLHPNSFKIYFATSNPPFALPTYFPTHLSTATRLHLPSFYPAAEPPTYPSILLLTNFCTHLTLDLFNYQMYSSTCSCSHPLTHLFIYLVTYLRTNPSIQLPTQLQ